MKSLKQLAAALRSRADEKQKSAEVRFTELATRIAEGAEPDLEDVETILDAAGKTAQDLEAAVQERLDAVRLADEAARVPELMASMKDVTDSMGKIAARRDRAVAKADAELAELKLEKTTLERDLKAARNAERELRRRNLTPVELNAAHAVAGLEGQLRRQNEELERATADLERVRESAGRSTSLVKGTQVRADLEAAESNVADLRAKRDDLARRLIEARNQAETAEQKMGAVRAT